MTDSELSASQLRQRYHRGGQLKDDELTSAQLRARHAIPSNSKYLFLKIKNINDFVIIAIL
jgi:hypothetical protein